jgi:ABC-type branched-subunit amino acid transport system ATPase component
LDRQQKKRDSHNWLNANALSKVC